MASEWLQLFVVLMIVVRGAVLAVRQELLQRGVERLAKLVERGSPGMRVVVRSDAASWSVEVTNGNGAGSGPAWASPALEPPFAEDGAHGGR
jgi:ribosomal protein S12 methylthiotransferase accessory factor YcaO